MARTWVRSSRIAALGIAAALTAATVPVASAQLPGVDNNTQVFPVSDTRILINVDEPDLDAGTVGVAIQNNTDETITCTGIDGGQAATVTTAEIAAKSVDFYSRFPHSTLNPIDIDVTVPSLISGSVGDFLPADAAIDLGSVVGMFPGSSAGLLDAEWGALAEIGGEFNQSRLDGHHGPMGQNLTLQQLSTQEFTVALGETSQGERQTFHAAVVMTCVFAGQRYIFHGYQGEPPAIGGTSGSLAGAAWAVDSFRFPPDRKFRTQQRK